MVTRRTLLKTAVAAAGVGLLGACGEDLPTGDDGLRTGHLDVPGARLYYEVRGSGRPLLMIHGGAVDAGSFAAIAPGLATDRTVITYDRRGNSRSTLTAPATALEVGRQADDATRLVETLVDERPDVFGSSGGAIVALEFAARHGDNLGTVVAHEPPVPSVLPDAAVHQAPFEAVHRTYLERGVDAAFEEFSTIDPDRPDPAAGGPYPADPGLGDRIGGNREFLLKHEMLAFIRYAPDIAALRGKSRLVLGIGDYGAEVGTRVVETLAGQVGVTATRFPGDHTGYMWRPAEFARKLREVLG
ncbi:alpha/beta fold hydrolase [Actinosynnema sp. CS-041913]|uniref:alpha/beta fold hydrolase n=1 Tax=Actinosynnema sp. CS-041913 TaxID=3239917 RepID=UPI003D8EA0D3